MLPSRLLDWKSAATFLVSDPDWRRKVWFGGLLMLLPPLGWPAALGFRKQLISRLNERSDPVLPEWKGQIMKHWWEGMKAIGVMTGYLSPIYALLIFKAMTVGLPPLPFGWLVAGFAAVFFLSPFLAPVLVVLSSQLVGAGTFSAVETVLVFAYFGAAISVLPAGYLQVSRTGSYLSAFNLPKALGLIYSAPRAYLEAWLYCNITVVLSHAILPLAPWAVFWCYLAIIYSFNEVRFQTGHPDDAELVRADSWFTACRGSDSEPGLWCRFEEQPAPCGESYVVASPAQTPDLAGFSVVRLGEIRAPLPRRIEKWISH